MEEKLLVTPNNQPTTIDMANVEQSGPARWKADICKYGFSVHCCCQKTFSHWTNLLIFFVRNLVRKNMFSKQVLHCDCFHSGAESTCRASWQPSQNAKQIFEQLKTDWAKNGCLRFVLFLINTVIRNVFLITIDLCLPRARLSGHKVLSISFSFNVIPDICHERCERRACKIFGWV